MTTLTEDQRNSIMQSCLATFNRYLMNADHHVERFTETFTEDVEWVRPGMTMRGHDEMQNFMNEVRDASVASNPPHGHVTRHMLTTNVIDVIDADNAEGTFYGLVFRHEKFGGTLPVPMNEIELVVEYRSSFRRTEEGWLICKHRAQHVFRRGH